MTANDNLKNILINLGLLEIQADIYLKLLETGETGLTNLAKLTKVKRPTLYLIIDKMKQHGLVEQIIDRRKVKAIPPKQLFDSLQNNNLAFFHALPQFQSLTQEPTNLSKIKFYTGTKGIQQLLLDELEKYKKEKEKTLRVISSSVFHLQDDNFREQYQRRRKELGVKTKLISTTDLKKNVDKYKNLSLNVQIKYLPKNLGVLNSRFSAIQDRLALIGLFKDNNGIIIESRELADTFIKWFDFTWSKL